MSKYPFSVIASDGLGISYSSLQQIPDPIAAKPFGQARIQVFANVDKDNGNCCVMDYMRQLQEPDGIYNIGFTYNSLAAKSKPWRLSTVRRLINAVPDAETVTVEEPDGHITTYGNKNENFYFAPRHAEGTPYLYFRKQEIDKDHKTIPARWILRDPKTHVTEYYDEKGLLRERADPVGRMATFEYTGDGQLSAISTISGSRYEIAYQGCNVDVVLVVSGQRQLLQHYEFEDDARTRLSKTTIADYQINYRYRKGTNLLSNISQTDTTQMTFNFDRHLPQPRLDTLIIGNVEKSEPHDNTGGHHIKYPSKSDSPVIIEDGEGNNVYIKVNDQHQISQVDKEVGYHAVSPPKYQTEKYKYTNGQLTEIDQADGSPLKWAYDHPFALLTHHEGADGQVTDNKYGSGTNSYQEQLQVVTQTKQSSSGDEKPTTTLDSIRHVYVHRENYYFKRFSISPCGRVIEYVPDENGFNVQFKRVYLNVFSPMPAPGVPLSMLAMEQWVKQQREANPTCFQLTEYEYNLQGLPIVTWEYSKLKSDGSGDKDDPDLGKTEISWDKYGSWLTKKVKQSATATTEAQQQFDALHRLQRYSDKLDEKNDRSTQYQYSANTCQTTFANGDTKFGRTKLTQWNSCGYIFQSDETIAGQSDPRRTSYLRDSIGRPAIIYSPADNTQAYVFLDQQRRVGYQVTMTGIVTETRYDIHRRYQISIRYAQAIDVNQFLEKKHPNMPPSAYKVENLLQPLQNDPLNRLEYTFFDSSGRFRFKVDGNKYPVETRYDSLNRPTATISYATKLTDDQIEQLKQTGNIELSFDPTKDRAALNFYDDDGLIIGKQDAAGYVTEYKRDGAGNIFEEILYDTPGLGADLWVMTASELQTALQNKTVKVPCYVLLSDHDKFIHLERSTGNPAEIIIADNKKADLEVLRKQLTEVMPNKQKSLRVQGDAKGIRKISQLFNSVTGYLLSRIDINQRNFADLRPAPSPKDAHTYRFFNGKGLCYLEVDAEGYVTTHEYYANRLQKSDKRYANKVAASFWQNPTVAPDLPPSNSEDQIVVYKIDLLNRPTETDMPYQRGDFKQYDLMGNTILTQTLDLANPTATDPDHMRVNAALYDDWGQLIKEANPFAAQFIAERLKEIDENTQMSAAEKQAQRLVTWNLYSARHVYNVTTGLLERTWQKLKKDDPEQNDVATLYYYDLERRPILTIDPAGKVTEFEYSNFGQEIVTTRVYLTRLTPDQLSNLKPGFLRDDPTMQQYLVVLKSGQVSETKTKHDNRGQITETTDPEGNLSTATFTAFKQLDTELKPVAPHAAPTLSIKHEYEPRGLETKTTQSAPTVADSFIAKEFENPYGKETKRTDACKGQLTTDHDRLGQSIKTTQAIDANLNCTHTVELDAFGHTKKETDSLQNDTLHLYEQSKRTHTIVFPQTANDNLKKTITNNVHGEQISSEDGLEHICSQAHAPDGQIAKCTDELGKSTEDQFNLQGWRTQYKDATGVLTDHRYNGSGQKTQEAVDSAGLNLVTNYTPTVLGVNQITADPLGVTTVATSDRCGEITQSVIDPGTPDAPGLSITTTTQYDGQQLKTNISVTDHAASATLNTTFQQDALDRNTGTTIDLGGRQIVTAKQLDKMGKTIAQTDANGNTTWTFYNLAGKPAVIVDAAGGVVQIGYDTENRVRFHRQYVKTVDPSQFTDQTDLTAVLALLTTNAEDSLLWYFYDANGNERFTVDSLRRIKETRYDNAFRKVANIQYANALDPADFAQLTTQQIATLAQAKINNAKDRKIFNVLDAKGQARFVIEYLGIDPISNQPIGAVTEQLFDNNGKVIATTNYANPIQDPESLAQLTPDQFKTRITPDAINDRTSYLILNSTGEPSFKVDALGVVTYFDYDKQGNQTLQCVYATPIDPPADYDQLVALLKSLQPDPQKDRITQWQYDHGRRISAIIDPLGFMESYTNDALGNVLTYTQAADPIQIQDEQGRVRYIIDITARDPQGKLTQGRVIEQEFDAKGNVIRKSNYVNRINDLSSLPTLSFAQAAALLIRDPAHDQNSFQIFNDANQLIYRVSNSGRVVRFSYNEQGDRISACRFNDLIHVPTSYAEAKTLVEALQYNPQQDHLTTWSYDEKHRITGCSGKPYIEEIDAVIREPMGALGATWTYTNDPSGRRIRTVSPIVNITSVSQNADGKLQASTQLQAVTSTTDYTGENTPEKAITALGSADERQVSIKYNKINKVDSTERNNIAIDDPTQNPTALQRPEKTTKLNTSTIYNGKQLAVVSTNEAGSREYFIYDSENQLRFHVNDAGVVIGYKRNNFDEVTEETHYATALDPTVIAPYRDTGIPLDVLIANLKNNADDRITLTDYNCRGKPISVTYSRIFYYFLKDGVRQCGFDNPQTRLGYNTFGDQIYTANKISPDAWAENFTWVDKRGKTVATCDPMNFVSRLQRDAFDQVTGQRDFATVLAGSAAGLTLAELDANMIHDDTVDHVFSNRYDLRGDVLSETQKNVVFQRLTFNNGIPQYSDVQAQDVTKSYLYSARRKRVATTYEDGNTEYTYYNALDKVIANAQVPRQSTDASGKTSTIIPLTLYGINAQGETVATTQYQLGTAKADLSGVPVPIAIDPLHDKTALSCKDKRGLTLATQDGENNVVNLTRTLTGKIARQYSQRTNTAVRFPSPQQPVFDPVTHIDVTRFMWDNLDRNTNTQWLRDNTVIDEFSTATEFNVFDEAIAEGRTAGAWLKFWKRNHLGKVYSENDAKGTQISLTDLNGQSTAQMRAVKQDLSTVTEDQIQSILDNSSIDDLKLTKFVRDKKGRLLQNWGPQYKQTPINTPSNLPLNVVTGATFPTIGSVSFSWYHTQETNLFPVLTLSPTRNPNQKHRFPVPAVNDRFGIDLVQAGLATDRYDFQIDFYATDPNHDPHAMIRYSSKGTVQFDTGITQGSTALVVLSKDDHTLRLTGNTANIQTVQLYQHDLPIGQPIPVQVDASGQMLVDVSQMMSGTYTLKPVGIEAPPSFPFNIYTNIPAAVPEAREITASVALTTLDSQGNLSWTVSAFNDAPVKVTIEYIDNTDTPRTLVDKIINRSQVNVADPPTYNLSFDYPVKSITSLSMDLQIKPNAWVPILKQQIPLPPPQSPASNPATGSTATEDDDWVHTEEEMLGGDYEHVNASLTFNFAPTETLMIQPLADLQLGADFQYYDLSLDRGARWEPLPMTVVVDDAHQIAVIDTTKVPAGDYPVRIGDSVPLPSVSLNRGAQTFTSVPSVEPEKLVTPLRSAKHDRWNNIEITNTLGQVTTQGFDLRNNPIQTVQPTITVVDEKGVPQQVRRTLGTGYDICNRKIGERAANSAVTGHVLDAAGQEVSTVLGDGTVQHSAVFDALSQERSYWDARGPQFVWLQDFNRCGNAVKLTPPARAGKQPQETGYDELQQRTSFKDGAGNITRYNHDVKNNEENRILALGQMTSTVSDRNGQPLQKSNSDGVLKWTRNYFSNEETHHDLSGVLFTTVRNNAGQVTRRYADRGHAGAAAVDINTTWLGDYAVRVEDKGAHTLQENVFDTEGQRVQVTLSRIYPTTTSQYQRIYSQYNAIGWLTSNGDNDSTLGLAYDVNGNRRFITAQISYLDVTQQKIIHLPPMIYRYTYDVVDRTLLNGECTFEGRITKKGVLYAYTNNYRSSEQDLDKSQIKDLVYYNDGYLWQAKIGATVVNEWRYDGADRATYYMEGAVGSLLQVILNTLYNENGWVKETQETNQIVGTNSQSTFDPTSYTADGIALHQMTNYSDPQQHFHDDVKDSDEKYDDLKLMQRTATRAGTTGPATASIRRDANGNMIGVENAVMGAQTMTLGVDQTSSEVVLIKKRNPGTDAEIIVTTREKPYMDAQGEVLGTVTTVHSHYKDIKPADTVKYEPNLAPQTVSQHYPPPAPSVYVVPTTGMTFDEVAKICKVNSAGDIARANNMISSATLPQGTPLIIPQSLATANRFDTSISASDELTTLLANAPLYPSLKMRPPPTAKANIWAIAAEIVVTAAIATFLPPLLPATWGTTAGLIISAGAANVGGQDVGMVLGAQQHFSDGSFFGSMVGATVLSQLGTQGNFATVMMKEAASLTAAKSAEIAINGNGKLDWQEIVIQSFANTVAIKLEGQGMPHVAANAVNTLVTSFSQSITTGKIDFDLLITSLIGNGLVDAGNRVYHDQQDVQRMSELGKAAGTIGADISNQLEAKETQQRANNLGKVTGAILNQTLQRQLTKAQQTSPWQTTTSLQRSQGFTAGATQRTRTSSGILGAMEEIADDVVTAVKDKEAQYLQDPAAYAKNTGRAAQWMKMQEEKQVQQQQEKSRWGAIKDAVVNDASKVGSFVQQEYEAHHTSIMIASLLIPEGDVWQAIRFGTQLFKFGDAALQVGRGGSVPAVGSDPNDKPSVENDEFYANSALEQVRAVQERYSANSPNAADALKRKYLALQGAQNNAVRIQDLGDGRVRYYGPETPSFTSGPTRGASYVTEYNSQTGEVSSWMESYTQDGTVSRIHPKMLNGQNLESPHFPPTAKELLQYLADPNVVDNMSFRP